VCGSGTGSTIVIADLFVGDALPQELANDCGVVFRDHVGEAEGSGGVAHHKVRHRTQVYVVRFAHEDVALGDGDCL
jgi:hypothetical protein